METNTKGVSREHAIILHKLQGCIHVNDLVRLYFPYYQSIKYAKEAFFKLIEDTPGMLDELKQNGYVETNTLYPPKVTIIITRYWGMPDAVAILQDEQTTS